MFTDTQKLNMLLENLTGWAGYSCKDLDDQTFLKLLNKAKCQRQQLEQIKEISYKALEPICYKSNCNRCLCYDHSGEKLSEVLNRYFTKQGEFVDSTGTFVEDLQALMEAERKACNRALPVAQQIIQILESNQDIDADLVGKVSSITLDNLLQCYSKANYVKSITVDTVRSYLRRQNYSLPLPAIENIVKLLNKNLTINTKISDLKPENY